MIYLYKKGYTSDLAYLNILQFDNPDYLSMNIHDVKHALSIGLTFHYKLVMKFSDATFCAALTKRKQYSISSNISLSWLCTGTLQSYKTQIKFNALKMF